MIDKINRVFAALVKPHWGWYCLALFVISMIFFAIFPPPKTWRKDFLYTGVVLYVICPSVFITAFSYRRFYTLEERRYVLKGTRSGIPHSDTYFHDKINSNTSAVRKFFGYLYVLTKVIGFGGLGYFLTIMTHATILRG